MGDFHVGGLVSGTDVQSIVDKLLEARTESINLLNDERVEYEADVAAWSDINMYMQDVTDVLDDLRSWDTWNQMDAISSYPSMLTATASTSAIEATYTVQIERLATSHSVASDRSTELEPPVGGNPATTANTDLVAQGVLTAGEQFTVEGATITIAGNETLNSLKDQINASAASSSVYAAIIDNRLTITRNDTGDTDITMADSSGTPLQDLHILSAPGVYENELVAAQDAEFTVNGATVNRDDNTNLTDVIEGVTLNLLAADAKATTITLDISHDTATPKDKILDFIDKYNTAIAVLDSYGEISVIGENPDGAELNSVGELATDSLVRTLRYNMRKYATESKYPELNNINASYTYNGNTGMMDSLGDVGVWTLGKENQLALEDEERLDYTLDNYFDEVEQLFRGVFDADEGYTHGVASDFYAWSENVTASITGDIDRRISRIEDQIDDLDENIDKKLEDLDRYEIELWTQFEAMENAIADMQSELSWLTSQLGIK